MPASRRRRAARGARAPAGARRRRRSRARASRRRSGRRRGRAPGRRACACWSAPPGRCGRRTGRRRPAAAPARPRSTSSTVSPLARACSTQRGRGRPCRAAARAARRRRRGAARRASGASRRAPLRPVRSIVSSASRARSGSRSSTRRAPWACTTIDADAVRDDVVQLARDPRPLLADGDALALRCSRSSSASRCARARTLRPDEPRRRDDQAGREQEALDVGVLAGDHAWSTARRRRAPAPTQRRPVLGVRAERVERDRAGDERRERRRLAVEQPAAEDRGQRGGRGEDARDRERRAPAQRRAAASGAAPPATFSSVAAGVRRRARAAAAARSPARARAARRARRGSRSRRMRPTVAPAATRGVVRADDARRPRGRRAGAKIVRGATRIAAAADDARAAGAMVSVRCRSRRRRRRRPAMTTATIGRERMTGPPTVARPR